MQNLKQIGLFVRTNLWIIPLALLLVWLLFRFLDPAPPKVLAMELPGPTGRLHTCGAGGGMGGGGCWQEGQGQEREDGE